MGQMYSKPTRQHSSFHETLIEMEKLGCPERGTAAWARSPPQALTCRPHSEDKLVFRVTSVHRQAAPSKGKTDLTLFGLTTAGHSVQFDVPDSPFFYVKAPPKGGCNLEMHLDYWNSIGITAHEIQSTGINDSGEESLIKVILRDPKFVPVFQEVFSSSPCNLHGCCEGIHATFGAGTTAIDWLPPEVSMKNLTIPDSARWYIVEGERRAQIHITVLPEDLHRCNFDDEPAEVPLMRILSFDIECPATPGKGFSYAPRDSITHISSMVGCYGDSIPYIRNVFSLGPCAPIAGAHVISFTDERDMLRAWKEFVLAVDPDLVTGYNMLSFDVTYLCRRAAHLGVELGSFGRVDLGVTWRKNMDLRQLFPGRVLLDIYRFVQRYGHLANRKLDTVAEYYLEEGKEMVDHALLWQLANGTPEERRLAAVYCLKDSYLPWRLLDRLDCVKILLDEARNEGVPLDDISRRGGAGKAFKKTPEHTSDGNQGKEISLFCSTSR